MTELTMVQAINRALDVALQSDPSVLVLGEDVGIDGGVFRATDGLLQRYGENRVFDTPLAETLIAGMGVGLAAQGFKPVLEIQFMGFIYSALDQLINHAARLRTRTRGRLSVPMVLRAPYGGGVHAPEHHSESTEALLAHIPGLRVVVPSSPHQAFGLLRAAIESPDPVVVLEPKRLYRANKEEVGESLAPVSLESANILRTGDDVTLVSWGAMLLETMAAARALAADNIEAEVIDLVSLKPIDVVALCNSVSKTGRLVVVHEAARTAGLGAEVAAIAAEHCLLDLFAPVERVTGYDTVMPLPKLEAHYLPNTLQVVDAAKRTMSYD